MTIEPRFRPRDRRLLLLLPLGGYLAALSAPGYLPALAAAALASTIGVALLRPASLALRALAAWPLVHAVVLTTGSSESPLLPFAAGWALLAGSARTRTTAAAATAAAVLILAIDLAHPPTPTPQAASRVLLLLAFAGALPPLLRAIRGSGRNPPEPEDGAGAVAELSSDVLARELELVRLATDAHQAVLWRRSGEGDTAVLSAFSSLPGHDPPEREISLEGHPFGWVLEERLPFRIERGRRPLPAPWAAEMLLAPVDAPDGVLALAYTGGAPPGAEASAVRAAEQLASVLSLLRRRNDATRMEERERALTDAMRVIPGELDVDRLAAELSESIRDGTGAAGVAVAVWNAESGRGVVLHLAGAAPELMGPPREFTDGESRAALAAKHGVALSYDDLRRERDDLPLLARGERWVRSPRSATVVPLRVDGGTIGVVGAWHPEPEHFTEREHDFLRLLTLLAAPNLHSATRYGALDRKASTDPLTGLPNRGAFDTRFAAAASQFERYQRPFSVVILDIDHFKRFNDSYGHEAGDRVLQHVGALMLEGIRETDMAARLGGEEFVLLLPETSLIAAAEAAERLRRAIADTPLFWNGKTLPVTASLGVACCPDSLHTPDELLGVADAALYRSKSAGRNRTMTAPPGGGRVGARVPG